MRRVFSGSASRHRSRRRERAAPAAGVVIAAVGGRARRRIGAVGILGVLGGAAACEQYDYSGAWFGENAIVFGVSQKTDANGASETSAGYDVLALAGYGGSPSIPLDDDRADTDGACWFERFDRRLGKPNFEAGGVAHFKAPAGALTVAANVEADAVLPQRLWSPGETLSFDVEGFAMPPIPRTRLHAPGQVSIASPPDGPITLRPSEDVEVRWDAASADSRGRARIMVALQTEEPSGRGGGVRCFFRPSAGVGVVGHDWIAKLFATAEAAPADPDASAGDGVTVTGTKKGTLEIATHQQQTIYGAGGWTVYVVATSLHRSQPFVSAPAP